MKSLVLASTSKYRREVLGMLQVPFTTIAPDFDERAHDHLFHTEGRVEFARKMAVGKARSIARQGILKNHVILAADQVVSVPELEDPSKHIQLHKPEIVECAVRNLMLLSGRTFDSTTGICVIDVTTGEEFTEWSQDRLTMRSYGKAEAEAYVRRFLPLDCAGAYRIADGLPLFADIQTRDWFSLQGMPLLCIMDLLRKVGILPK